MSEAPSTIFSANPVRRAVSAEIPVRAHQERLPGIEGLRGLAILLVVLFKFAPRSFPGGWLGVDLFFVISGFVITRRIMTDLHAGRFSLFEFYQARARRLLPALLVMLTTTAVVGGAIMLPMDFDGLAKDIGSVAVGLGNFRFWRAIDYWRGADGLVVLHGWSLGVEEQFYLFYPLLLSVATKRKRALPILLGIGTLGSALIYFICLRWSPAAAFYLLPTRAWELLIGAFLAVSPVTAQPKRLRPDLVAGGGLVLIAIGLTMARFEHVFQGALSVPICFGAGALILGASRPADGMIGRLLSLGPARFLGRISYSVYLWHLPILVLYLYEAPNDANPSVRWALIPLILIVATFSYRWIERPIRRRDWLASTRRFSTVTGLSLAVLLFAMAGVVAGRGLPQRWPSAARAFASTQRVPVANSICDVVTGKGNCLPGQPLDLLIWGDSHAYSISYLVRRMAQVSGARIGFATQPACSPLPGLRTPTLPACAAGNEAILAWVDHHSVRTILIADLWIGQEHTGPLATVDAGDGVAIHGLDASVWAMRALVSHLRAAGIRVVVEEPTPVFKVPVVRQLSRLAAAGQPVDQIGLSRAAYDQQQQVFKRIIGDLADTGQIEILQTGDLYCGAAFCPAVRNGVALFWDTNHLSVAGYEILAPRLLDFARTLQVNSSDRSEPRADASDMVAPP